MDAAVITLQLLLLLPALPLAVMSQRTSRAQRDRHQGLLAVACLVALLATLLALTSLALSFDQDTAEFDPLLHFVPPVLTLAACAFVLKRGLSALSARHRRRPGR